MITNSIILAASIVINPYCAGPAQQHHPVLNPYCSGAVSAHHIRQWQPYKARTIPVWPIRQWPYPNR